MKTIQKLQMEEKIQQIKLINKQLAENIDLSFMKEFCYSSFYENKDTEFKKILRKIQFINVMEFYDGFMLIGENDMIDVTRNDILLYILKS